MANALYGLGRQKFLEGGITWGSGTIKLTFVDSADYTLQIDTHDFYDDVTPAGRVGTSGAFAGKTQTLGVADADDVTVTAVTGDQFEYIIIWQDTAGAESTDPLICCIDTATGLPCTPNGGDITVQWDSGANKILKL